MSKNLYHKAKENADKIAEICKITDSWKVREIIAEELKKLVQHEATIIVDTLNTMGGDIQDAMVEGFLEGINKSHRCLQGEFWSAMLKIIKKYGESKYFDPRNEFAVKMCKRMAKAGEQY